MDGYYEHHTMIKQDKLCPFIINKLYDMKSTPCNWHGNLELLLVTEGEGAMLYGNKTLKISKGDIIIVNSGVIHRPYSDVGLGCYYIIIDESFCIENGINTKQLYFREKLRDDHTEKLFLDVTECADSFKAAPQPILGAKLRAAVLNLMVDISVRYSKSKDYKSAEGTGSEGYVKAVIEYLNRNYTQPVSLDKLAKLCGITKFYLAREFKRLTGQTVLTYTNTLRCKKASFLLADGKSVTDAALESGFGSLSYFSRTYKRLMSDTPSSSLRKALNKSAVKV